MASLAGKLLQDCNIIFVGRLFISRLLASKKRASCFSHFIYLEESFRDDIEWLLEAIQIQNGVSFLVHKTSSYITLDTYFNRLLQDAPCIGAYNHLLNEYNSMFPCPLPPGSYFWSGAIGTCPCGTSLGHTVCVSTKTNISQIHHDYRAEPAWLDQGKLSSRCLLQDDWYKMSANHPEFHKQL